MMFFWFKDVHYIIQSCLTVCSKADRGIQENCSSLERQSNVMILILSFKEFGSRRYKQEIGWRMPCACYLNPLQYMDHFEVLKV